MTDLYRHYDAQGALLYVGIADDWQQRLRTHSRTAEWFPRAARLSLEYHPTRESAAAAELAAIRTEWPLYNVFASPWKTGAYLRDQRWIRKTAAIGRGRWFGNGRKVVGAALDAHNRRVWREIDEQVAHVRRLIRTVERALPPVDRDRAAA
jgi:predicted GIY-YIG superfamily endonuclease